MEEGAEVAGNASLGPETESKYSAFTSNLDEFVDGAEIDLIERPLTLS